MPATTTVRFMNEALYVGYLGAQRDFALIVDNAGYNLANNVQNCQAEIGCASDLTKMLMNFGIQASMFNRESSGDNLLVYYTSSSDFDKFGKTSEDGSWYNHFIGDDSKALQNSDFADSEAIRRYSCGTNYGDKSYICDYSKEMTTKGYSIKAGNAMILLFENGNLYDVITDNQLDPTRSLNRTDNNNLDQLDFRKISDEVENKYYENIIYKLRSRINVDNATNNSTQSASGRSINLLSNLQDLTNLVNGGKGVDDYLLLVTSDGFISSKVGKNYSINDDGSERMDDRLNTDDPEAESFALLFNTVSTYMDNCALESEPLMNFLRGILEALMTGGAGALLGAAAGAGIGALVGSIVPGIGTAIGAGVGAIAGAIAGFFAGLALNKAIEEKLKDGNGISGNNYCKIMTTTLDGVEINVPIYTYNIKEASKNVSDYRSGILDPILTDYYDENYDTCRHQATQVAVPSGAMSMFIDGLKERYSYADACEKEVVSDIVGGVYASPSLQLFLNGKKVDDLHGRVTTELIMEMLFIWGLKTIGNMYTIASTGKLNDMSVTIGSAKQISNVKYCISDQITPSCSNGTNVSVSGSGYIGATTKAKGITIQFADKYKAYSRQNIASVLPSGKVNAMIVKPKQDDETKKKVYLYSALSSMSSSWSTMEARQGDDASQNQLQELLDKAKSAINTSKDFLIKYKGVYYVICTTGERVGYKLNESGNMILVYYAETSGGNEYIFEGDSSELSHIDSYYNNKLYHDSTTDIDAGHDVYIYIAYNAKDEEGNTKTLYYSYVI